MSPRAARKLDRLAAKVVARTITPSRVRVVMTLGRVAPRASGDRFHTGTLRSLERDGIVETAHVDFPSRRFQRVVRLTDGIGWELYALLCRWGVTR